MGCDPHSLTGPTLQRAPRLVLGSAATTLKFLSIEQGYLHFPFALRPPHP